MNSAEYDVGAVAPVTQREFEGSGVPEATLDVGLDAYGETQERPIDPLNIVQKRIRADGKRIPRNE